MTTDRGFVMKDDLTKNLIDIMIAVISTNHHYLVMRALYVEGKLLSEHHEALQRKSGFEVGLALALHGPHADTILRLIPTPEPEDDTTTLDVDWVSEHATQVASMLPGGLVVVGFYLLASSSNLSSLEPKIVSVLAALAKQLPSTAEKQAVVLQLPTDSRKPICRTLAAPGAKLQTLELKLTSSAAQVDRSPLECPANELMACACF